MSSTNALTTSFGVSLPPWIRNFVDPEQTYISAERRLSLAIRLAKANVFNGTGGPFGAVVVSENGQLISVGVNLVTASSLSIMHAEAVAISLAQTRLHSYDLSDSAIVSSHGRLTLASSAQMCAMCLGVTFWAGIPNVEIGASATDTLEFAGFDEGPIHPGWREELALRGIVVTENILRTEACEVLAYYRDHRGVIYNSKVEKRSRLPEHSEDERCG